MSGVGFVEVVALVPPIWQCDECGALIADSGRGEHVEFHFDLEPLWLRALRRLSCRRGGRLPELER